MSTPPTQTTDAPAAPAAANAVVASAATTATFSASSASVVTSTVTTPSSPKRTISVGGYHKTLGNARDTLFEDLGVGSGVGMEEGEEEKQSSSSGRDGLSVGTRPPRKDDSDASSSKRSSSGSDMPLADAGALSTPRGGDDDDSTLSAAVTSRTNRAIIDDDVTKELDFDPATSQRRDFYIGLFHELRFYGNKKHSRKSKVTEWEALCQSWGVFVDNFNRDPAGYRERVRSARERYVHYSKRPKI
ncbi:hypothetical protein PF005_g4994 [Phytophthora fragariae]|uniref:Uncharacterized protein n=1 Tax=Phytophthora fragariae TaxID=53985 RepID=A0A6A4A294_9STRA|nr:hypothetical protein PF011_g1325 [Phytophthora fragariae]KAE9226770.1 hypothetical protein PF005_g4994 [Phytophthora fragariae]KAE9244936.1 hypothetical protein PF002_g7499 [Phytophthora fragariae]KAE9249203.1 hypothetical protein PF004_g3497 [Phytophthora fragariae]